MKVQTINITSIKAKLMAIYIGLLLAMEDDNNYYITVITDSLATTRKILDSYINPLQTIIAFLVKKIKKFLNKDNHNTMNFWYHSSKAEWPRHKLVDDQVKQASNALTNLSKNSFLFSKKKKYNNLLRK